MNRKLLYDPGEPEYELARYMAETDAPFKEFDRVMVWRKNIRLQKVKKIVELLAKQNLMIMHESDIDGG